MLPESLVTDSEWFIHYTTGAPVILYAGMGSYRSGLNEYIFVFKPPFTPLHCV